MDKEFIPYEQALELKGLGFDEKCFAFYKNTGELIYSTNGRPVGKNWIWVGNEILPTDMLLAPIYQQAFRWFREKYLLHHEISCGSNVFWFRYGSNSHVGVLNIDTNNDSYFATYEEAELFCLIKLIEIIKNK